jgi:LPXTG-motif cell wall-anchored protein
MALVAGAVIAPSAAFADSTVSFSQSTICPDEWVTISSNGYSDGTVVSLPLGQYSIVYSTNQPTPYVYDVSQSTGLFPYAAFAPYIGETVTFAIVTADQIGLIYTITSTVSSATIQVLSECGSPAPEPEAEALPNTGASAGTMTALSLGATVLGLGGAVLTRRARRAASTK